jgi:hypothetical protein
MVVLPKIGKYMIEKSINSSDPAFSGKLNTPIFDL